MITIYIQKLKPGDDGHAAGRALLAKVVGDKALITGPKGKPYAADGSVFFNISHCDGAVGVAVAGQEVGLDLEPAERAVKRKSFTGKNDPDLPPIRLWVLKESLVKWGGDGILALRGAQIKSLGQNRYQGRYRDKEALLQAFEYEGLVGAICCETDQEYEIKEM